MSKTREYSNGEITVVWKLDSCTHAAECVKGSLEVFNPKERPWIKTENSNSKQVMETVDKCPSGALSYRTENAEELKSKKAKVKMELKKVEKVVDIRERTFAFAVRIVKLCKFLERKSDVSKPLVNQLI